MKFKNFHRVFLSLSILCLIMINIISASALDIPNEIKIKADSNDLYEVEYDTFYISARKMHIIGRNEIVYCLDVDESYPANNTFKLSNSSNSDIVNIINAGYPNRTYSDLNLSNENEAYFATQLAIWSKIEGYNVDKLKGNKKLVNAIKEIYNSGSSAKYTSNRIVKEYDPTNKSIQRALVIFDIEDSTSDNDLIPPKHDEKHENSEIPPVTQKPNGSTIQGDSSMTEEEAENIQSPYPPQEG